MSRAPYAVPIPLPPDAGRSVATTRGVPVAAGGKRCAKRATFLTGPRGKIAKIRRNAGPGKHSAQVLADPAAPGAARSSN